MRVLVTGFEPFGGHPFNPSGEVARRLGGVVLPVSGRRVLADLAAAVERERPQLLLSLGLAEDRDRLCIERVGINVLDFRIADNDGYRAEGEPVLPGGPAAYLSPLPLRAIEAAWIAAGIPGVLSNSAGTFCCNQVLYGSLSSGLHAGFVHLPPVAAVPIEDQLRGVRLAIEVAAGALVHAR